MATTHDLELSDLLEGGYAAHRFREQVMDDGLVLDYLIRPGPSTSRNAIALLRLMHYPDSVIADALASIDWPGWRDGQRSEPRVRQRERSESRSPGGVVPRREIQPSRRG